LKPERLMCGVVAQSKLVLRTAQRSHDIV